MNLKHNLTLMLSLLTSLVLFPMNSTAAEQPNPTSTIYMITLHTDKFEGMLDFYSSKMDMKALSLLHHQSFSHGANTQLSLPIPMAIFTSWFHSNH